MAHRGSLKLVGAVEPSAGNDDSFMSSLKEIESMERHRIARLTQDERDRAEHARVLNAQAEQKLSAERARADAEARAAEQLLELREREAAAVVAAKTAAIVEVEKIGAEGRMRLDEIAMKRKHELEVETLRISSNGAAVRRSILSGFVGALVVLAASVGIQIGVVAPAANQRVSQANAALVEKDQRIQTLERDALAQAAHARSVDSDAQALRAQLDEANKRLADTASKPLTKPPVRTGGAAVQARGNADYGMPLCPPGVTWDPLCVANPKK